MTSKWCYIPNMKTLGLVVSDKKIFENCILKPYFLTLWPTYATNWNGLNNFDRGPHRNHSCEVWSKSNKWFQRRCCLKKLLTDARMDARTDDGQRTPDIEGSQKLTEHFVLRWAKNHKNQSPFNLKTIFSQVLSRVKHTIASIKLLIDIGKRGRQTVDNQSRSVLQPFFNVFIKTMALMTLAKSTNKHVYKHDMCIERYSRSIVMMLITIRALYCGPCRETNRFAIRQSNTQIDLRTFAT